MPSSFPYREKCDKRSSAWPLESTTLKSSLVLAGLTIAGQVASKVFIFKRKKGLFPPHSDNALSLREKTGYPQECECYFGPIKNICVWFEITAGCQCNFEHMMSALTFSTCTMGPMQIRSPHKNTHEYLQLY